MSRSTLTIAGLAVLGTMACRPLPGDPDYPEITPYEDTSGEGRLPGDTPWDGTTPRLSMTAFYEGGSTDAIVIDNETVNFYIYEGSFTAQASGDHVEGLVCDQLTVSASTWWGGGIHVDGGVDLSDWTTLHVALRSEDASMEAFQLGMVGSLGEGRANVSAYGFVADGDWHVLNIPLDELTPAVGFDAVTVALLMISATATPGANLFIDDLYLTKGG